MYPYMPKRVKTAYFIWLQENIEQIKEPGMRFVFYWNFDI